MKLANSNVKSSITAFFAITLLVGFLSIAYIQNVNALISGLDLSGLQGLSFLKGPKGDKGDTEAAGAAGAQGEQGVQGLMGDKGDSGAPCHYVSSLHEMPLNGPGASTGTEAPCDPVIPITGGSLVYVPE